MDEKTYLEHEAATLRAATNPWIPGAVFRATPGLQEYLADCILEFANRDLAVGYTGPKSRRTDPATSTGAEVLMKARAGSARIALLEAFGRGYPMNDKDAALHAGLSLQSEYATRCSELRRLGVIEFTGDSEQTSVGMRMTSIITPAGLDVLRRRSMKAAA